MARGKVMGISTNTLLLIGAGAVAVYLITKPKTTFPTSPYPTPYPGYPPGVYPPGYIPPNTSNTTTAIAGDIASILGSLFNNIF